MTDADERGWWATDPTGRHQLRYWDGAQWTAHVSDQGQVSADPVDGPPAPPALLRPSLPPPAPGTGVDPRTSGPGGASPAWWRSLDGLRTALVVLLACSAAASLALVLALVNRLGVIDDIEAGQFGFELLERARDADDAVELAASFSLALALASAVLLIVWQWRCAKNAELLGRDRPRFGPGWSIGGWFIPFANLVIPVLIVQDLWRASSPDARPGAWRTGAGSGLVGLWWAVFVLGAIGRFVDADDAATLAELKTRNQILLAGSAVSLVAAALTIAVVVQLTRRFDENLFPAGFGVASA